LNPENAGKIIWGDKRIWEARHEILADQGAWPNKTGAPFGTPSMYKNINTFAVCQGALQNRMEGFFCPRHGKEVM
jgi:hypothetical protein